MTRDEAIAHVIRRHKKLSFSDKVADADYQEIAECDIDNYVALGMLKLDEPKNEAADRIGFRVMRDLTSARTANEILAGLEMVGLRIVEK